jgi:uncharacterized lipoprotein YajG
MLSAEYKKNFHITGWICWPLLLLILFLSGCAEKGPILLNVAYQEPAEKAVLVSTVTVGVSPFKDARGKAASVLGKRKIPSGQENDFVVQGTVADIATSAVKKALASRGITVKDAAPWDLTEEGMKAGGAGLLLGGEVKMLWLDSTPETFNTHVKATVQIKIVAGDPSQKRIVRTLEVSSKLEQNMLYSQEQLEITLSEGLTSAVNQIFQDEDLKKRLQ